jgi:hypothetical protein
VSHRHRPGRGAYSAASAIWASRATPLGSSVGRPRPPPDTSRPHRRVAPVQLTAGCAGRRCGGPWTTFQPPSQQHRRREAWPGRGPAALNHGSAAEPRTLMFRRISRNEAGCIPLSLWLLLVRRLPCQLAACCSVAAGAVHGGAAAAVRRRVQCAAAERGLRGL